MCICIYTRIYIFTKVSAFNLANTVLDDQSQSKIYLLRLNTTNKNFKILKCKSGFEPAFKSNRLYIYLGFIYSTSFADLI